jgi:hypothetical protein
LLSWGHWSSMTQSPDGIIRCPACGRTDVRRSLPRGLIDSIFLMLGKKPVRCRGCECRFHRVLLENAPDTSQEPPEETVES